MPVSVSNTAYGIINDAMHDAGLIGEGDDPNSEQLATNMRRLCDIINYAQTQGIKLFLQEEVTIPLVAGTNTYSVNQAVGVEPNKNLRIIQGRIVTPTNEYRPIFPISWQEWNNLSQNSTGAITGYFVDKKINSLDVSFWNTPDAAEAANTAVLLVHKQADNPFNLEADVGFPQEWRLALRWALADDIATGQPQAIMDRCQQRARTYMEQLENWDVEDTPVMFAVDSRQGYGRFR